MVNGLTEGSFCYIANRKQAGALRNVTATIRRNQDLKASSLDLIHFRKGCATQCLAVLLSALTTFSVLRAAEDRFPNLASGSSLPRGPGLAVRFKGDFGISAHPAVIFADNFENGELGSRWDETNSAKALNLRAPGDEICGRRCLKVEGRLGENQGGGLTKWFEPAERVFVRFYVRFDADCDYVHHFVTLRANKGARGGDKWSGFGGAGLRPEGNERFSTALEPWGNWSRWPAPGKWNFYSYWHEMQASPDGKYWGNSFLPEPQEVIRKERWICAEFMLKHNTPGQPDGEQAFWIDGRLLGHWRGINWRKTDSLKANALTLESYVTDRWTKNPTNIVYFDNLVIAREYIGPAGRVSTHGAADEKSGTPGFERGFFRRSSESNAVESYFPPPESADGWRKLESPKEIRGPGGADPAKQEAQLHSRTVTHIQAR
jgi:hypothetical protein